MTGILLLFGPLLVVCGLVYVTGQQATSDAVLRVVSRSALIWFAVLSVIYCILLLAMALCSGNMLYGYDNCVLMPLWLANLSFTLFAVFTGLGILYGVVMAAVCGIAEWRYRCR